MPIVLLSTAIVLLVRRGGRDTDTGQFLSIITDSSPDFTVTSSRANSVSLQKKHNFHNCLVAVIFFAVIFNNNIFASKFILDFISMNRALLCWRWEIGR